MHTINMLNSFDALLQFKAPQGLKFLLTIISLLGDPKLHLCISSIIAAYCIIKFRYKAFERKLIDYFFLTVFVMFVCGILKITVGRARPFLMDDGVTGFLFFSLSKQLIVILIISLKNILKVI